MPQRLLRAAIGALLAAGCASREPGDASRDRDLPAPDCRATVDAFAAEGLAAGAARAAARGLAQAPDDVELHQRLIDLHCAANQVERLAAVYSKLRQSAPASATVAWYVGYVELLKGDVARRERRLADARSAYGAARRELAAAAAREPDFAEMTRRIDHLAALGLGSLAREEGDRAKAEELLLERLSEAPDLRDVQDGLRRSLLDALQFLGGDCESAGDFAAGVRLARAVVAVEPESSSWWNNLGYFLREHASLVEAGRTSAGGAPKAAARALFRESWEAYLRASELAPTDARIVNDTALIQVYHLQDELDRAQRLLHQAIEVGEQQLVRMGPNPREAERFPVAQAVGDAWLNLGYLHYHLTKEWPLARDCFVKSLATNSGDRGENQAYVDSIDGKREPVPMRALAAMVVTPQSDDPPHAQIAWERSFDSARSLAALEHRALFVYCRGEGLTLAIPFLDRSVARRPLAEAVAGMVCVVADHARHGRADRDSRGRRVLCPRFGAITCGDHLRAWDEICASWPELRVDGEGAEPTEGFLLLGPDGARLVPGGGRGGAFGAALGDALARWRAAVGPPIDGIDLAAHLSDLLWNEGLAQLAAAQQLVDWPSARARGVVEALLGVGDRAALPIGGGAGHELVVPTSTLTALLDALAARPAAENLELLDALVDAEGVAPLALDRLPPGADVGRVWRALQWSDEPQVRSAAARALLRLDDGEETRRRIERVEAAAALDR